MLTGTAGDLCKALTSSRVRWCRGHFSSRSELLGACSDTCLLRRQVIKTQHGMSHIQEFALAVEPQTELYLSLHFYAMFQLNQRKWYVFAHTPRCCNKVHSLKQCQTQHHKAGFSCPMAAWCGDCKDSLPSCHQNSGVSPLDSASKPDLCYFHSVVSFFSWYVVIWFADLYSKCLTLQIPQYGVSGILSLHLFSGILFLQYKLPQARLKSREKSRLRCSLKPIDNQHLVYLLLAALFSESQQRTLFRLLVTCSLNGEKEGVTQESSRLFTLRMNL